MVVVTSIGRFAAICFPRSAAHARTPPTTVHCAVESHDSCQRCPMRGQRHAHGVPGGLTPVNGRRSISPSCPVPGRAANLSGGKIEFAGHWPRLPWRDSDSPDSPRRHLPGRRQPPNTSCCCRPPSQDRRPSSRTGRSTRGAGTSSSATPRTGSSSPAEASPWCTTPLPASSRKLLRPVTCLMWQSERGTYRVTHGTGDYRRRNRFGSIPLQRLRRRVFPNQEAVRVHRQGLRVGSAVAVAGSSRCDATTSRARPVTWLLRRSCTTTRMIAGSVTARRASPSPRCGRRAGRSSRRVGGVVREPDEQPLAPAAMPRLARRADRDAGTGSRAPCPGRPRAPALMPRPAQHRRDVLLVLEAEPDGDVDDAVVGVAEVVDRRAARPPGRAARSALAPRRCTTCSCSTWLYFDVGAQRERRRLLASGAGTPPCRAPG